MQASTKSIKPSVANELDNNLNLLIHEGIQYWSQSQSDENCYDDLSDYKYALEFFSLTKIQAKNLIGHPVSQVHLNKIADLKNKKYVLNKNIRFVTYSNDVREQSVLLKIKDKEMSLETMLSYVNNSIDDDEYVRDFSFSAENDNCYEFDADIYYH
jgi:hypothetical protein